MRHPDEIEPKTLEALQASVALLQAKSPEDLDDYRILVMDVAESVAAAAKGGEVAEAAEVEKIRQAVGGRPD
jgi:regulator of RNase E activity RraA